MEIYVDGAAAGNGSSSCTGGTGFVILDNDIYYTGGNKYYNTTNQQCELQAFLDGAREALKINPNADIYNVYSDSAYFTNCYFQNWYKSWQRNGFINSKKQPVKNRELWEQVIPFFSNEKWHFFKVHGHADNEMNNMADKIAFTNARR